MSSSTQPPSRGLSGFLRTSIGAKTAMAITGVIMVGFLVVHMLGNLQIFAGREVYNSYAYGLKSNLLLLWGARFTLLGAVCVHILSALRVTALNRQARPVGYRMKQNLRSTAAGRYILMSGLVILAFIIYHILHYTVGVVSPEQFHVVDSKGHHDAYGMMVQGFQIPVVAGSYLFAMALLWSHLSHGVTSMLNTLGITTDGHPIYSTIGPRLATFIVLGNIAIVVGVWLGYVPDPGVL